MQYKISVCKFESNKEREITQEMLISASHPRAAIAKALRLVSKSRGLGKWSGSTGNVFFTYERLTEREANKFAATQAIYTIIGGEENARP